MARTRGNMSPRGAGIFLLIFGIFWIFGGVFMTKQYNKNEAKKKVCIESTRSVVTDVNKKRESYRSNGKTKHRTVYHYTYEFEVDGQKYHGSGKSQSSVSVGSQSVVYYNPDNPNEFITSKTIKKQDSLKVRGLIMKIVGGIIAVGGLFMFVTGKRIGHST